MNATTRKQQPRPNIFVVGDAKCGTTTLYRMFQLADGIDSSKKRKEQHYFSTPELVQKISGPGDARIPQDIVHNEADYLAEFAHIGPEIKNIADVSPSYLSNPPAAKRIHEFEPDARIIIMLREPGAKVFSQYTHLWSEGREELPFEEAFEKSAERRESGWSDMFDYEGGGWYADSVERYFELFGRDRVMVVLFNDMFGGDTGVREEIESFLDIRFAKGLPPKMNASGRARSPVWAALLGNDALRFQLKRLLPMSARTKIGQFIRSSIKMDKPVLDPAMAGKLRRYYAKDRERLEALLGRKTGWPED